MYYVSFIINRKGIRPKFIFGAVPPNVEDQTSLTVGQVVRNKLKNGLTDLKNITIFARYNILAYFAKFQIKNEKLLKPFELLSTVNFMAF